MVYFMALEQCETIPLSNSGTREGKEYYSTGESASRGRTPAENCWSRMVGELARGWKYPQLVKDVPPAER